MKRYAFLLFTLFIMAFAVACGDTQAVEVDPVVSSTAVAIAEAPAVNTAESQTEPVLEMDEAVASTASVETAVADEAEEGEIARPDGWSEETHSKSTDPNYEVVFPADEVNTLAITIEAEDWQAMLQDMTALYGEAGSGGNRGGGPGGRPAGPGAAPGADADAAPGTRPGAGGPGGADLVTENPMWVAGTIEFEGDTWTDVGVRFKGNSSLMNTWSSGSLELPFKLDFDEFEDENPSIDNQRFYGFKQLSLSNNFKDATFMRDAVTSDIFADAGIASAETAFYELFVDYGEGPVSFGLYTMIEVIDDTVIDRVFGDDNGNIYEADGTAVSLAEGTFEGITTSFQKENNEDEADWSDIETLYSVLHSDSRQTDPAAWKADLEAIFDVDTFLHWLAINTVIENWDTYGAMTHNFYLYNDPETGLLTWIPWDHNEALSDGKRSSMTFSMNAIGDEWPLISYLLADSEYYATYVDYVEETINTVFEADAMAEKYQEMANLIEPYVTEMIGADAFAQGLQALTNHTYAQVAEAETFLTQVDQ
jgi:spore coat protein H